MKETESTGGEVRLERPVRRERLIVQRRPQGGLPWENYAFPQNDEATARGCLAESIAGERDHSKFPGKFRLIREIIEVIE